MAGLYIHIPFCASRCIYCGFYSTTRLDMRQKYVDAVCREMEIRGSALGDSVAEPISTIYLGGGTPSQLTIPQLRQLFIYINKVYKLSLHSGEVGGDRPEVTIEMNPDDVTPVYAATLSQLGINRVSMGAQTFDDNRLRFLRRRHSAAQVRQAITNLRMAGMDNISVDLMYGFPDETLGDFQRDIEEVLKLDVEHISAYCLMIEEGTVLYEQMRNGEYGMRNGEGEELERRMYECLIDRLAAAGYEHYEISNFARPGFRSRHNSSYWTGVPYIGLGAAAHSYESNGKDAIRSWNVSDISAYIDAISLGKRPCESEVLTAADRYNESVMLGLRTCEGLKLGSLSEEERQYCLKEAEVFLNNGLLQTVNHGDSLVLTREGLFVSDMVMAALMMAD